MWFAVGTIFFIVGIAVGTERFQTNARLEADGRPATGIVVNKIISGSTDGSASTYRAEFRFVTEQGDTVSANADLDPDVWDGLRERGPIEVRYLPEDPETYRVPGQRDGLVLALVFGAVGAAVGGIGAYVLLRARRNSKREAELERSGIAVEATIIDLAPGNLRVNGVAQWKLRYRYQDSRGRAHEGSCTLSPQEAQSWEKRRSGRVRYDSLNPQSHVWIGTR